MRVMTLGRRKLTAALMRKRRLAKWEATRVLPVHNWSALEYGTLDALWHRRRRDVPKAAR
jgi:hypothetical protein